MSLVPRRTVCSCGRCRRRTGRAFGVMQGGVQVMQGIGVLATGLLADRYAIGVVVGGWSLARVLLLLVMWPRRLAMSRTGVAAREGNH